MQKALALGLLLACVFAATGADARSRHKHKAKDKGDSRVIVLLKRVIADNEKMSREIAALNRRLRPDNVAVASADTSMPMPPRNPLAAIAPMPIPDVPKTIKGYEGHIAKSAKLKDLTPPLALKVAEILESCDGARLTSGYRRGARVAGSGRSSLHSRYPSRAADLAGNPSCIRKHLAAWPGGLSTDYSAVRHYHVSYDPKGREWGMRFAHRGSRYARHHRRYAAIR